MKYLQGKIFWPALCRRSDHNGLFWPQHLFIRVIAGLFKFTFNIPAPEPCQCECWGKVHFTLAYAVGARFAISTLLPSYRNHPVGGTKETQEAMQIINTGQSEGNSPLILGVGWGTQLYISLL